MKHVGDNVVAFFKHAATKLEELQLQGALGRAELTEKLEQLKKEARQGIHEMKAEVNTVVDNSKEKLQHLKGQLEHLEVQLALGKAETMEEFDKQKKKIAAAFQEVKRIMSKDEIA